MLIETVNSKQEALEAAAAAPAIDWTLDERTVVQLSGQEGKDWISRIRAGEFKKSKRAS